MYIVPCLLPTVAINNNYYEIELLRIIEIIITRTNAGVKAGENVLMQRRSRVWTRVHRILHTLVRWSTRDFFFMGGCVVLIIVS